MMNGLALRGCSLWLASLLLLVPAAQAGHLPELLAQEDEDGGHTLRLLIDDGDGGSFEYTRVDVSEAKGTLSALLKDSGLPGGPELGALLDDVEEPVTEAGAYTHAWQHGDAPMLSVGVYLVHREQGLIRAPLLLLENVSSTSDLAAKAAELVVEDGMDMAVHVVPFLLEAVLVEQSSSFQEYPEPGNVGSYRDKPTVYAWHARKVEAGQSVWHGWYLQRTGDHGGVSAGAGTFDGFKRVEVGSALRVNGQTQHAAGVYVETELEREAEEAEASGGGDTQSSSWRTTVGATGDSTGDLPVTSVVAEDDRWDTQGDPYATPDEQSTRFTVGVWLGEEFVPLLGVETHAMHRHHACPEQPEDQPNPLSECIEQVRTHSVGTFVDGNYTPVAGVRYHGERLPLVPWVLAWIGGGGPGAQNTGAWSLAAGVFVQDGFVPLAGVHYDQGFEEARDTYQMRLSAGVYVLEAFQPLVAVTYDGERPLIPWSSALTADDRDEAVRWMVTTGVYALDRYIPVLGMRYLPYAEGGEHEQQHQFAVGTFLGHYDLFVPLIGAQYDGESGPVTWALAFAAGGALGAGAGQFMTGAGVFLFGTYQPVVSVKSQDEYDSTTGPHDAEQQIQVGVHGPDGAFVPLVGILYGGDASMGDAIGNPTTFDDDEAFRVTAGAYLQGEFLPLVGVHHSSEGTRVTVLPSDY